MSSHRLSYQTMRRHAHQILSNFNSSCEISYHSKTIDLYAWTFIEFSERHHLQSLCLHSLPSITLWPSGHLEILLMSFFFCPTEFSHSPQCPRNLSTSQNLSLRQVDGSFCKQYILRMFCLFIPQVSTVLIEFLKEVYHQPIPHIPSTHAIHLSCLLEMNRVGLFVPEVMSCVSP